MDKMAIVFTAIFTVISIFAVACDIADPNGDKALAATNKTRLAANSIREQSAGQRTVRTGFMHGK